MRGFGKVTKPKLLFTIFLFSGFFIVGTILVAIILTYFYFTTYNWVTVKGTVIESVLEPSKTRGISYNNIIKFEYNFNNKIYKKTASLKIRTDIFKKSYEKLFEIGEDILIKIDPNNPDRFLINKAFSL